MNFISSFRVSESNSAAATSITKLSWTQSKICEIPTKSSIFSERYTLWFLCLSANSTYGFGFSQSSVFDMKANLANCGISLDISKTCSFALQKLSSIHFSNLMTCESICPRSALIWRSFWTSFSGISGIVTLSPLPSIFVGILQNQYISLQISPFRTKYATPPRTSLRRKSPQLECTPRYLPPTPNLESAHLCSLN